VPERPPSPVACDPELPIGSVFGGTYEILSLLGTGTFGRVYRGRDRSSGREVAIKILRLPAWATDGATRVERFRREMQVCRGLVHPHIVRLVDSGETESGLLFGVFDYVPGSTLKEILAAEGRLPPREAVHLLSQVLDALGCAHAQGVVHRDLKPENIMVTRTGVRRNAFVLDFGLGGLLHGDGGGASPAVAVHELLGTPCYAAPEQLRGEPPSPPGDLYAWGIIAIECLTGELPVHAASVHDVVMKQLGPEPVPIPGWLRAHPLGHLLETATAKRIERRTPTAAGLLAALDQIDTAGLAATPGPAAAPAAAEGERRQLTVVCCRLMVETLRGGRLGLEDVDELLHSVRAAVARTAARAGGHVVGVMADRVLLVFGYPQAREHDARQAVRLALQVVADVRERTAVLESSRHLRLDVRIGVHTGLVIVREPRAGLHGEPFDVVGVTPQTAARLEELAGPGQVLVSDATYRLLRGQVAAEHAGEHVLPGRTTPTRVFRVADAATSEVGLDSIPGIRETPLIGRRHQIDQLVERWNAAAGGRAGFALVTGEPGIGKSRLVRELRRRAVGSSWMEGRCVPENQGSPLRPIIDLLRSIPESLDVVLARYRLDVAEMLPPLAALLSLTLPGDVVPPQHSPNHAKDLTLRAIVTLLLRRAAERPVILALEDLQWADPTTLDMLTLLSEELAASGASAESPARLLVLLTARPAFTPPWPTGEMFQLPVLRLERDEVEQLVVASAARGIAVSRHVLDDVVQRADGVPLFVEEIARVLATAGLLSPEGSEAVGEAVEFELPETLRDLLAARLDGLSHSARETAQLAATLGRDFSREVLSAVADTDASLLREDLRELTDAGLVYQRSRLGPEQYLFKHALVRDAAYETMTRATRQKTHERVAAVLTARFPDVEHDRPDLVAQHFEHGGQPLRAAEYWKRSGDRTMARGAYVESIRHFERGLRVLASAPADGERVRLELGLVESLGTAQLSTQGYASPEVERTFAHAQELCDALGEDVPLRALHGIFSVRFSRAEPAALAILPTIQRLAERSPDPVTLLSAHAYAGQSAFHAGEFARARDEMQVATQWYSTDEYRAFVRGYGYDGGLYVYAYLMWSLWVLGHPDMALGVRDEMLALSAANGNAYGRSVALGYSANLAHDRGEPDEVLAITAEAIAHASEQKLYLWLGPAMCSNGWALVQQGAVDVGIDAIQQGLGLIQTTGLRATYPYHQSFLVEGHLRRGTIDDGLAVADDAIATCRTTLDRFYEGELLRLRGELLRSSGRCDDAEAHFRQALALARRQGAASLELRAALSLCRVGRARDVHSGGHSILADAIGRFGDDLDTPDLCEARSFLARAF